MVSLLAVGVMNQGASAFSVHACVVAKNSMQHSVPMSLNALPEKVEVCGNKDCRRAGGGAKLENLVKTVSFRFSCCIEFGTLSTLSTLSHLHIFETYVASKTGARGEQSSRDNQSRRLRMSRGVWLRTESPPRWKDCKRCQGKGCGDQSSWDRTKRISLGNRGAVSSVSVVLFLFLCCSLLSGGAYVDGFVCHRATTTRSIHKPMDTGVLASQTPYTTLHPIFSSMELCMNVSKDDDNEDTNDGDDHEEDKDTIEDNQEELAVLNDLDWRVEKLRLEEANTRRFLKAGPRFLPYEECRKWVSAWNRWESEEDWGNWINEGEKRNSYIPARPDEYYGNRGEWKGWDHFLGVENKKDDDDCDEKRNEFQ